MRKLLHSMKMKEQNETQTRFQTQQTEEKMVRV